MPSDAFTIVTGASDNHFRTLVQLIRSIQEYEAKTHLIVYDLGLSAEHRNDLAKMRGVNLRTFEFDRYPSYFKIDNGCAGHYAWKPTIIADVMNERKGIVLWLDAGCKVTGPLQAIRKLAVTLGLYTPGSSGTIDDWTHKLTLKRMFACTDITREKNRAGGIVAVHHEHKHARDLIQKWKACALQKSIIAPAGSSRENHRQDQSVLSVLVAQAVQCGTLRRIPRGYLNFSVHNDID